MKVVFTLAAEKDLQRIYDTIIIENPAAADRVRESIGRSIQLLKDFPQIGRLGIAQGTREKVVADYPYVIVYTVNSRELIILRIYHAAQKRG